MSELILIVALCVVSLGLLVCLIVLLSRRSPGAGTPELAALSGKLEQLQSMAGQLSDLHRFMLLPGARGAVGETLLAQLLQNWLPTASFDLQYEFRNGARADAVIRMGKTLVSVDSKFPREAIERSMQASPDKPTTEAVRVFQKQIEEIAKKYIRPEEGTLSFALLYCPSEAVYRYLFTDGGLLDESLRSGVVPVSPATLFAYLQTVSYGLRGLSVDGNTKMLIESIQVLRREFDRTMQAYQRAGGHLRNAVKAYAEVDASMDRTAGAVNQLEQR